MRKQVLAPPRALTPVRAQGCQQTTAAHGSGSRKCRTLFRIETIHTQRALYLQRAGLLSCVQPYYEAYGVRSEPGGSDVQVLSRRPRVQAPPVVAGRSLRPPGLATTLLLP